MGKKGKKTDKSLETYLHFDEDDPLKFSLTDGKLIELRRKLFDLFVKIRTEYDSTFSSDGISEILEDDDDKRIWWFDIYKDLSNAEKSLDYYHRGGDVHFYRWWLDQLVENSSHMVWNLVYDYHRAKYFNDPESMPVLNELPKKQRRSLDAVVEYFSDQVKKEFLNQFK